MHKSSCLRLPILLVVLVTLSHAYQGHKAPYATELRSEHAERPLGLDGPPRFSWAMAAPDSLASYRGFSQHSFQIEVLDGLKSLWDSGEVQSNRSLLIETPELPAPHVSSLGRSTAGESG